ncbi:hypothetical protein ACFLVX_03055 [Chloroflexota bacterium]
MPKYTLNGILEHLRQELILTEAKAREIGSRFEALRRETESMKVDALQNYLEEQRKSTARDKGITSLIKDRKRVRDSLIVAVGSVILGGLLTRDKFGAVTAGMSGFNGMLQGYGESKWCVLLGKKITVVPEETIFPEATWITLASFHKTMEELKKRALSGEKLGSLDDVISKLMKKPRLIQQLPLM